MILATECEIGDQLIGCYILDNKFVVTARPQQYDSHSAQVTIGCQVEECHLKMDLYELNVIVFEINAPHEIDSSFQSFQEGSNVVTKDIHNCKSSIGEYIGGAIFKQDECINSFALIDIPHYVMTDIKCGTIVLDEFNVAFAYAVIWKNDNVICLPIYFVNRLIRANKLDGLIGISVSTNGCEINLDKTGITMTGEQCINTTCKYPIVVRNGWKMEMALRQNTVIISVDGIYFNENNELYSTEMGCYLKLNAFLLVKCVLNGYVNIGYINTSNYAKKRNVKLRGIKYGKMFTCTPKHNKRCCELNVGSTKMIFFELSEELYDSIDFHRYNKTFNLREFSIDGNRCVICFYFSLWSDKSQSIHQPFNIFTVNKINYRNVINLDNIIDVISKKKKWKLTLQ